MSWRKIKHCFLQVLSRMETWGSAGRKVLLTLFKFQWAKSIRHRHCKTHLDAIKQTQRRIPELIDASWIVVMSFLLNLE